MKINKLRNVNKWRKKEQQSIVNSDMKYTVIFTGGLYIDLSVDSFSCSFITTTKTTTMTDDTGAYLSYSKELKEK